MQALSPSSPGKPWRTRGRRRRRRKRKRRRRKTEKEDEWVAEQLEQREPAMWAPLTAPDGRTYFWHCLTMRVRWTLPAGALWWEAGEEEEEEKEEDDTDYLVWVSVLLPFLMSHDYPHSLAVLSWVMALRRKTQCLFLLCGSRVLGEGHDTGHVCTVDAVAHVAHDVRIWKSGCIRRTLRYVQYFGPMSGCRVRRTRNMEFNESRLQEHMSSSSSCPAVTFMVSPEEYKKFEIL